ncbi:MAG: hypothetical protein HZB56_08385 [Deltaproteobacteria bacterium]|nr:hypothetical protein [Deltaproteobacteria bacterium]
MTRICLLALSLLAAAPAGADGYDEALAEARREAAAGRFASAARLLEAPARRWPQDYPVQLERAWFLFQAGAYGEAAAGYRQARALAPEAVEPVLGLGWTALREEDAASARGLLEEALRRSPESGPAREGLALLGPENRLTLALGGGYTGYEAASRPWLATGTVSLDGLLLDRLAVGALYRLLGTQSSLVGGRGRSAASAPLQHELHGSLGWSSARWSAMLHGGWIGGAAAGTGATGATLAGAGTLAGASGWGRPLPWLELDGALLRTFRGGGEVTQWQAAAGVRLSTRLLLRAGARGQDAPEGAGLAGLVSLELRGRTWGWLAGEMGTQRQPVDLAARVIHATPAPLRWAARTGVGFPLGGSLSGVAALDLEAWGASAAGATDAGLAWRGSAGLRLTF